MYQKRIHMSFIHIIYILGKLDKQFQNSDPVCPRHPGNGLKHGGKKQKKHKALGQVICFQTP